MEDNKPIKNLKITYDGKIYDQVTWLSIHNKDKYNNYEVSFTNVESETQTININCMLKDVEILTK